MPIGVFSQHATVDALVAEARDVAARGFDSFWVPQIFGLDAITALGVVAHDVPTLSIGTAVVPTYPRHPMMLAAQALTLQQLSHGRFTLGIGLSHQIVIESMLGISFDKPVRHLREYLSILLPLVRGEASDFAGDTLTAKVTLDIPDAPPVPVLVAALGSQLLKVAGTRAEGTITWMTGPATIESHVGRPSLGRRGRRSPRTPVGVAALPVAVTTTRCRGASRPARCSPCTGSCRPTAPCRPRRGRRSGRRRHRGRRSHRAAGIKRALDAGATEFVVVPFANRERTLEVAQSLV
jgi:F420-dependent oxidoreductase-like protein